MPFVDANGVSLHHEFTGGSGPVLVLVHEMGGSLLSWDGVLETLAGDLRLLRYDMRGHGLSEKIRGSYSAADAAADLAGLLDALHIEEPVILAGCAVGACVALQFAADHPARTRAVVAMAPATGVREEMRAFALGWAADIERVGMRRFVEEEMAPNAWPVALRSDPERFARFRGVQLGNDPASFAATWRMLVACEVGGRLGEIACPVLLVAGSHDVARSPAFVEALLPGFRNARMAVLDSGHFMMMQTPEAVAGLLASFVEEQTG